MSSHAAQHMSAALARRGAWISPVVAAAIQLGGVAWRGVVSPAACPAFVVPEGQRGCDLGQVERLISAALEQQPARPAAEPPADGGGASPADHSTPEWVWALIALLNDLGRHVGQRAGAVAGSICWAPSVGPFSDGTPGDPEGGCGRSGSQGAGYSTGVGRFFFEYRVGQARSISSCLSAFGGAGTRWGRTEEAE